jgi:FtsH-binding integral membrane protein
MNTQNFTEHDSLKLINEMINKAKKSNITKGIAPILWGALIFFCSLTNWYQFTFKSTWPYFDVWLLTNVGLVLQIYFSIKDRKNKGFAGYADTVINQAWIAFTICMFLIIFFMSRQTSPMHTSSLVMMIYGVPTFLTGGATKFKPMIFGGIFCWVASLVSMFTGYAADTLLMAACGLVAWLIPGIILWRRYKKSLVNV